MSMDACGMLVSFVRGAGLAALLMLAGCMAQPIQLNFSEQTASVGAKRIAPETTGVIVFHLCPLVDLRPNSDDFGQMGGRLVTSDDFHAWLQGRLSQLSGAGFLVNSTESAGEVRITPRLKQAYIHGLSVTKTATVILEIVVESPGRAPVSKLFRGSVTRANWASGEGELIRAFQTALDQCMVGVVDELNSQAFTISSAQIPRAAARSN